MGDLERLNIDVSFWRDRNVLVTGCTGLLGSWLCEYLVACGANVVGLVRDRVPKSRLLMTATAHHLTLVHGSIEDYKLIERALGEYEVQTVFHLAAQTVVTIANRNPISTFESNIKGTWSLFEACRRCKTVQEILLASSDKAYGEQSILPYTEESDLRGRHPYDVSKSCADLIAFAYYQTYRLPVCIVRCGNFYGPGDLNFSRIVPGTIRSVLRDQRPVVRSSGRFLRDYLYIKDGAGAYLQLAERACSLGLQGEAFNFSNEHPVSVLDLVHRILVLMKSEHLQPVILDKAENEIPSQWLSARKARKILSWEPRFTLEEGLVDTIEWYRELFKG